VGNQLAWSGRAKARNVEEERAYNIIMCYAQALSLFGATRCSKTGAWILWPPECGSRKIKL
jgi:hypothetical protein